MKKWNKGLALLLAVSMVSTAIPSTAIASNVDYGTKDVVLQEEIEGEELNKDNSEQTEVEASNKDSSERTKQTEVEGSSKDTNKDTSEDEKSEDKESDKINDDKAGTEELDKVHSENEEPQNLEPTPREVVEEYRTLTVGQELHQTDGSRENYLFAPEESGYYRFSCESLSGQNLAFAHWKTIYDIEDENGNKVQHEYINYQNDVDTYVERLVWLNQKEKYVFYCNSEQYYEDACDFKLKVDKVAIDSIDVLQAPTEDSYHYLNLEGMQVRFNYVDGTNTISKVYKNNRESLYCDIDVLDWCSIAHEQQCRINADAYIIAVDNEENWNGDCSNLSEGKHTITLRIEEYIDENGSQKTNNYDFQTDFIVKRGNIKALKVEKAKTDYTQDFQEQLENFRLLVSYNDGTKDKTISSSDQDVSQYLTYSVETEKGLEEYTTTEIDTYLKNGGKVGKATVFVSYRGGETSYEINIAENPYESMEVVPKRTIYYTNCGYDFGESSYSGDNLDKGSNISIIMNRKDGTKETYSSWYELENCWERGDFGLKLENNKENEYYYRDIDRFISDGGTIGTQEVEVSYCGIKASYQITIQENPYDHIKIAAAPSNIQYIHNQNRDLDLSGLVIYAYYDAEETESNYDVYNYNDYLNFGDNQGTMTEEQYNRMNIFNTHLGGHESIEYLELGEHTVHIFLMGHQAEYKIQVIEKLIKSLRILQSPERLSYYAYSNSGIYLSGLIIEIEDLEGNVKKYKYEYKPSEEESEFENWWDLSDKDNFNCSYNINWNKTGNYTITLSYLGAQDTFEVTIVEAPVKSIEITKMPDKKSYYEYETGNGIDLRGMEYQVTYKDGTTYSGKAEWHDAYFTYGGESFHLLSRWNFPNNSGMAKLGDNAIVVYAMGVRAVTDTIVIKENPVASIKVLRKPEKLYYINREPVDLYGMELQITYIDGTDEKISFTEHVSELEMSNTYGGTITADINSNNKNQKYMLIQYRNENCSFVLPPMDFSKFNPIEMTEEGSYHTILTEEELYKIYAFTPTESKTYHFFSSGNYDTFVELYEGNELIDTNDDGGEENNFKISYDLKANTTYYYIVSEYSLERTATFDCYFSPVNDSLSDLEITNIEITQTPKREWYDFESGNIWAENISLYGTVYEIMYSNGWKQTVQIDYNTSSIAINGTTLSVKWKYTTRDEYGEEYVEKRKDNALVYTYGEKVMEFPAAFDVPTPVESLEIIKNPWKDQKIYEYQWQNQKINMEGLSVKIHYKDGRESETVTWEDNSFSQYHNGYCMQISWDTIQAGKENQIIFSYMGKETQASIMILENPVKSIQILQRPEKQEYYSFEETIDLYGMKLQITYKDRSVQTVEANTHSETLAVSGTYAENLTTSLGYSYDELGNERRTWYLNYMGYRQEIMPYKIKLFMPENALALTENEETKITLDDSATYQIFSFSPVETGIYRFAYAGENEYKENRIGIYNATGKQLNYTWGAYLNHEMTSGKHYYIVVSADRRETQNLSCSMTRQPDTVREPVKMVNLSLSHPKAGELLEDFYYLDYDEFYASNYRWLNDTENDQYADYGTAHRLKLVLNPYSSYQFTSSTQVMINGSRVREKSVGSDGKLTLYYTFPYTQCKVTVPQTEGYELDESQNAELGTCNYGEDYKFRYVKKAGNNNNSKLIVKANDTVLLPDAQGYYVIEKATENINVIVKTEALSAGSDESKLTLYNKSNHIFDILTGKRNAKIADNEGSEKMLPSLTSYVNGSDQFFFGWYLDKDQDMNGKGTRFTSKSVLKNPSYALYAKWGSGLFSCILNNKWVNYKILSIDEENRTKVQVGDGSNQAVKSSKIRLMRSARAAQDNSTLVIPEKIDLKDNADLSALGINFAEAEVIAIAENAFAGEGDIKNISLPSTIKSIGNGAFTNCTNLESVDIPEGVSTIGENAFRGCESLQKVAIPSSVSTISEGTFQGCTNLTNVNLAEGVTEIGANAFHGCENLTTITLPDTIETIDTNSFAANQELTIICSNEMKKTDTIKAVQEATGAIVVAVDVKVDYNFDEKVFTYGDKAQKFTASVNVEGKVDSERKVIWKYTNTKAYDFAVNQKENSLTVTPKTVTSEDEIIKLTAIDEVSGRTKTILLKTIGIDLGGIDTDKEEIYSIQTIGKQKYTGKAICPKVIVINNITKEELAPENYKVSYENNLHVGTASVRVEGKGNYTGSLSTNFIIEGQENPEVKKKNQTIKASDIIKMEGDAPFNISASTNGDGTLSYQVVDTKIATIDKKGKVTIKKAGKTGIKITASETEKYYAATKTITLTVAAQKKKNQTITASDITKTYGNKDFKLKVSKKGDGALSYKSSNPKVVKVNSKTGLVKIVGAGTTKIVIKASATKKYNLASKTIKVTIKKADAKLKISKKSYKKIYGDKAFKLKASAKASLSYKVSNKKVATVKKGTVTIKGCGTTTITVSTNNANYKKASKKITIKVLPKKATLQKVSSKKVGQMTVSWKKQKEAAGYVVEYSTNKNFKKSVKKVDIKKNKTTSTTIKKLSKGKKYYVRVKAYTKINKKKEFGGSSKVLNIKIKNSVKKKK